MTPIHTFFLRVSARCNLDCSYCYVFKHCDQTWKKYPSTLSKSNIILFANRIHEYATQNSINNINVVFHGGEPTLIGRSLLLEYVDIITKRMKNTCCVEFSIQTNGTLLTKEFVDECSKREIKMSISIDGPNHIHNKNRKMPNGTGSFDLVLQGIKLVQEYPDVFQGVIGVIDPYSEPSELFSFFKQQNLHNIDLLLPDANYDTPPKDRNSYPDIYKKWLIKAFDTWFDEYQDLSFKTYEFILKAILGSDASSDSFGLGKLNYITIEADGSYHTTDILKVAYENASSMGASLKDISIEEAARHEKVHEYNALLEKENLPPLCKSCKISKVCGGGSLPHRYSKANGFHNPTIYCDEMNVLITHAQKRLSDEISKELEV